MKRIFLFAILAALTIISDRAYPYGIGLYFTGGGANASTSEIEGNLSLEMRNTFLGGGFVYDSGPARNRLINYRLNAGFDSITLDSLQSNIGGIGVSVPNLYRVNIINTFGLGIYRAPDLRFWLGPQVSGHFLFQEESNLIAYSGGLQAGLALGLNINIRKSVSLAVDGGLRYGFTIGRAEVSLFNIVSSERNFVNYGFEGYGSVAVMYRIKDEFIEGGDELKRKKMNQKKIKSENKREIINNTSDIKQDEEETGVTE